MNPCIPEALLGRVGEVWLLVGYTVAMVRVAFLPGAPRHDGSTGPAEAQPRRRLASRPLVPGQLFSGMRESRSSTVSWRVS